MKRLTFVDEKGQVLFQPSELPEDEGVTIKWLSDNNRYTDLEQIACTLANLEQRLKVYDELKGKGLLVKLPVAIGDTVYVLCECGMIPQRLDGTLYGIDGGLGTATGYYCPYEDECPHDCVECDDFDCDKFRQKSAVFEDTVSAITVREEGTYISTENCAVCSTLGYAVFLTRIEAEDTLQKMKQNGKGVSESSYGKHSNRA